MNIDEYGKVSLTEHELLQAIYTGKINNFQNLVLTDELVIQFNNARQLNQDSFVNIQILTDEKESIEKFDKKNYTNWFIPEHYKNFNIVNWLYDQCITKEEFNRVGVELELFVQYEMYDLLIYLKYLVDVMRENKVVWGVGRGSSVASYVLYLIGIHKINSIKYNLDINEFLK